MEFLVKIKTIKGLNTNEYYASNNLIEMYFVECDNKEKVKEQIAKDYPSLFTEGKVYQKKTKQEKQLCYVQIEESDSWTSQRLKTLYTCLQCGESYTGVECFNLYSKFPRSADVRQGTCYCDYNCKEKHREKQMTEHYNNLGDVHYIYKVTEKETGLSYIGKTSNMVFFRWYEHLKHSTSPFGLYLRKKKLSEFTFEVIEELNKAEYSNEDVLLKESEYILIFDTINNGFNELISNTKAIKDNRL